MLPPSLVLVAVEGQCCKQLRNIADLPTTTHDTRCYDRLDNCRSFTKNACSGIYRGWAEAHCPMFCGICSE